ncbi:MAG TPA: Fe-Mn family superoxide dismutase [Gaiellaceae bacterium]|nr:Fe-Mn family superoxide dismutase [Gaiellaceae bacterium]
MLYAVGKSDFAGTAVNIARTGVLVRVDHYVPNIGARIRLFISDSRERQIEVDARAVRIWAPEPTPRLRVTNPWRSRSPASPHPVSASESLPEEDPAMADRKDSLRDAFTRRETLESLAAIGAGVALATTLTGGPARSEQAPAPLPLAYRGEHAVKPLPFDPKKLKGLSERLLVSHHQNNYGGAVKRLNLIQQQLGALPADAPPHQVGSLKREELIATNSMILHELYFANLGGSGLPDGTAAGLLRAEYGSLERWEQDLRQTALSLGGGSGWVVVAYHAPSRSLHNWWAWDHTHHVAGGVPVLVLDLYEHAYHMDYGAGTKAYLDAFLGNVQWDEVNRRVEVARSDGATRELRPR